MRVLRLFIGDLDLPYAESFTGKWTIRRMILKRLLVERQVVIVFVLIARI